MRRLLPLSLLFALTLGACEGESEKLLVVWPGMSPTLFNHVNEGVASLSATELDWIGVNSPVVLVFRQGDKSVSFRGTRRGGGVQILSSADPASADGSAKPVVTTVAFNLGGSLENVAALFPMLEDKCHRVAAIIGAPLEIVPDAAAVRELMRSGVRDVSICSAKGRTISFSINAWGWPEDGNHDEAYLDGFLGCTDLYCGTVARASEADASAAPPARDL